MHLYEPPSFDACPVDVKLEVSNSFRAVPQSTFKDSDTMIQVDTFENYIESLLDRYLIVNAICFATLR